MLTLTLILMIFIINHHSQWWSSLYLCMASVDRTLTNHTKSLFRLYDVIIFITTVTDAWQLCQQDRTMRESVSGQQIFSIAPCLVSTLVKMQIQIQAQIQIQIYAYKYSTKYNKWGKESWVSRSSQLHSALSKRVWNCRYKYKCKYKYNKNGCRQMS